MKGDIFRHTIYPPSFAVIVMEGRGGGAESTPPGHRRPKEARSK